MCVCVSRCVQHSSPAYVTFCHFHWQEYPYMRCTCSPFSAFYGCVYVNSFASVVSLNVSVCAGTFVSCKCVCVYIFPAALPPGMQHGSLEGDISTDHRASFPSPLPSGVALNIKLFNLIQFPTTNTLDWIQMPATSGPTPGLVCA